MAIAIFISGTDTGVGKTRVAALLCRALGADVAYYKPLQTGVAAESDTDCYAVSQLAPQVTTYNSYSLALPAAPQLAAEVAGVTLELEILDRDFAAICDRHRYVVVEGAGGLAVPLWPGFAIAHLVQHWQLPLVLVSRPQLGTINHTCLSHDYARHLGLSLLATIINYHEPLEPTLVHTTVPALIAALVGDFACYTLPWQSDETPLLSLVVDLVNCGR